jgi:hypothetical protein
MLGRNALIAQCTNSARPGFYLQTAVVQLFRQQRCFGTDTGQANRMAQMTSNGFLKLVLHIDFECVLKASINSIPSGM